MTIRSTTRSFRENITIERTPIAPIVLGGVYRVINERGSSVEIGDICILVEDDGSVTPLLYSEKWGRSMWVGSEKLQFLGVLEG